MRKLLASAAMYCVLLALGSCADSGGSLTLTDIPAKFNGKYVKVIAEDYRNDIYLAGFNRIDTEYENHWAVPISGGKAKIPMWINSSDKYYRYAGNHTIEVEIIIYYKERIYSQELAFLGFESIKFNYGNAALSFKDADDIEDGYDKGKWTYSDGSSYEGEMLDGEFHGKGKYTWASGDVYEGDWVIGERNGKGKFTFADGDIFEGYYVNGKRDGKGKYTFANGQVEEGYWENGEPVDN